jgi:chromosome segregation ATPase
MFIFRLEPCMEAHCLLSASLQQAASKAAAAQEETKAMARAAEARAAEAMVQATKARREGRDASAKAEQAEAKAEQAEAKAEQAKTDAAEARATVEALQRKLALLHKGRVATINSKLCRLKESLKGFEQVLRYEVLVRIMRSKPCYCVMSFHY